MRHACFEDALACKDGHLPVFFSVAVTDRMLSVSISILISNFTAPAFARWMSVTVNSPMRVLFLDHSSSPSNTCAHVSACAHAHILSTSG